MPITAAAFLFAPIERMRLRTSRRRFAVGVKFATAALAASFVQAAAFAVTPQNVYVDFTNFGTRLSELATAQGVSQFTASEQATIQSNIVANLGSIYGGFTVNFSQAAPTGGPYETLTFGNTTTSTGLFGISDGIDYRNLNQNNNANIYTRNFGYALSSADARALQITKLSTGLSGTGAHELGHNLGLQHFDSYGDTGITPANYSNTGGLQNTHIMATGQTGLSSAQRYTPRAFNTVEKAKLEFAQGLTLNPPAIRTEQAGDHSTLLTAQAVDYTYLSLSGVNALSLTGSIAAAGQLDFYSFSGTAGSQFTASILSTIFSDARGNDDVNSILTLFDASGNQLFLSNDVTFSGNAINLNAASGTETNDAMILNYLLPTSGTYYLRVGGTGSNATGNYELFSYGANLSPAAAPEPSSLMLLGMFGSGAGIAAVRRRRRVS